MLTTKVSTQPHFRRITVATGFPRSFLKKAFHQQKLAGTRIDSFGLLLLLLGVELELGKGRFRRLGCILPVAPPIDFLRESEIAVMKTSSVTLDESDILEYKLKYTPDLRCEKETDLVPVCYRCKSCILSWKIFSTREWFVRASQATQRSFVLGIINRFESHDLLKYAWNLLQAIDTKDFTYSRSCVSSTFRASSAMDRAMDPQKLAQSMADLWRWFVGACFWTKANYILLLLQMCDSQLLLMAATLIRIHLTEYENAMSKNAEKGKFHYLPELQELFWASSEVWG